MDKYYYQIQKIINNLFIDIINGHNKEAKFMDGRVNDFSRFILINHKNSNNIFYFLMIFYMYIN